MDVGHGGSRVCRGQGSAKESFVGASADLSHRSLSAIQVDVRAALHAEATSRRLGPNTSDVIRLIDLYREMAAHPKRDRSLMLKQIGSRLRSRLEKVSDHIERKSSRAMQDGKKTTSPALRDSRNVRSWPNNSLLPAVLRLLPAVNQRPGGRPRGNRLRSRSCRYNSTNDFTRYMGHQRRQRLRRLFRAAPGSCRQRARNRSRPSRRRLGPASRAAVTAPAHPSFYRVAIARGPKREGKSFGDRDGRERASQALKPSPPRALGWPRRVVCARPPTSPSLICSNEMRCQAT